MKRIITVLAILLTVAFSSLAQSHRWELLRAEYGSGGTWVDVTERVRTLVNGDSLNMRVDNFTLGGDPAPGARKTLRLRVRDDYGREQLLTYPEKESFSLNIRSSNPGYPRGPRNYSGPPQPGYSAAAGSDFFAGRIRVMRAQYGIGSRYVDVTDLLNSRIQGDSLSLRVANDVMGGDPDPERRKQLIVFYIFNGRQSRVVVNEKGNLNLPGSDACSPREYDDRMEVLEATYGAGDRRRDGTSLVRSQVRGNSLQLFVSNAAMGGDPAENQKKRLRVIYLWQGLRYQLTTGEAEPLAVP